MEVTECAKIIHERIHNLEPENATKITGFLLLKYTHQEIMQYALGPDKQIHSLISEAKANLGLSPKPNVASQMPPNRALEYLSFSPTISRPFSSPSSFRVPAWEPHLSSDLSHSYNDLTGNLHNQAELLNLEEQLHPLNSLGPDFSSNYYYSDAQLGGGLGSRTSLRSPTGLSEFPVKACHYFYKGYCKHGINCRYFHGQTIPDSFSQMYSLNPNEFVNDDHLFSPGSLEKLEIEISELLKVRKGFPISIASLPMMYLEKYGKALQAEGYLTESQRHGKVGFSLTKLLARLKSIRLIDRPHGQHSVVLAEDAPKYMEYRNERSDPGAVLASSHQIYLTFPAESTFTDEDVLNYFKQYGPVRDVRIPRQEKRMFGFVSFLYPETVKTILAKGHPHNICGSRVLVKPYKEKARIYDRKYTEKIELPMYYPSQYFEMDPDLNTMPRVCENSRLLKKQLILEHEHAIELERRRLLELQLTPKPLTSHHYLSYRMEDLKNSEDHLSSFPAVENSGSTSDDKPRQAGNNYSDQESGHIELPDSPFASPRLGNTNIYTVV